MKDRTTPANITKLEPNQIFCFGSNLGGRHGKGAAKTALRFGAKYGVGFGLEGQTFAIPTKDARLRVLPVYGIGQYVRALIITAIDRPDLTFLCTEIGCGLAGYAPADIAPLFADAVEVENIHLPAEFWQVLTHTDSHINPTARG